jgi:hypothetical protein
MELTVAVIGTMVLCGYIGYAIAQSQIKNSRNKISGKDNKLSLNARVLGYSYFSVTITSYLDWECSKCHVEYSESYAHQKDRIATLYCRYCDKVVGEVLLPVNKNENPEVFELGTLSLKK